MRSTAVSGAGERDIAGLNYLTRPELEARYRLLTDESPPQMNRAMLITAVAYETIRQLHRLRLRHVARR